MMAHRYPDQRPPGGLGLPTKRAKLTCKRGLASVMPALATGGLVRNNFAGRFGEEGSDARLVAGRKAPDVAFDSSGFAAPIYAGQHDPAEGNHRDLCLCGSGSYRPMRGVL